MRLITMQTQFFFPRFSIPVFVLFACLTVTNAQAQQWTHSKIGNNPGNSAADCAFEGSGPASKTWYCEIHEVQIYTPPGGGTAEMLTFREQDVGSTNANGEYVGEYKRSEISPMPGNWKVNQLYRSFRMTPNPHFNVTFN